MPNSVSTQHHKNTYLNTFIVFIGLLLGGTAKAGFGELGTGRTPTTATQAMEWSLANSGQCPLFPEEWRSGSTLDLEIPEIKLTFGRGGVAMKIDGRRFVGRTMAEFWARFPYNDGKEYPPNMTDVFEYCQKLYGMDKTKAWSKALEATVLTRVLPGATFGSLTLTATGVASSNIDDGRVVAGVAGIGIFTSLAANWVGRRVAGKQAQNSEAPNLIRQLFVEAQAQEQRARDLAVRCESGSDQLTMETDTATLEQSVKDCRAAKAAYEPQHHAWQTKKVWSKLLQNEVDAIQLIQDKNTLDFSTTCDSAGKTSRTKLRNYDALKLSKTLLKCEHLAGLLKEAEGWPATASHYQTLGVLSASRVQAIIKRIKKAEKARQRRETAKQKAESAKQRKAAAAFLERLLSMSTSSSTSSSSSAGEYRQSCTYENLMSNLRGWTPFQTTFGPGGDRVESVYFIDRSNDLKPSERPKTRVNTVIEEAGCRPVSIHRIPGTNFKGELGVGSYRVDFD
jgi:hypothetical protein